MDILTLPLAQQVLTSANIATDVLAITRLQGGSVNHTFALHCKDRKIVLWIDGKSGEQQWGDRASKLEWIYESLEHCGLPIPQLIFASGPDSLLPSTYLLITHLPGEQIDRLLPILHLPAISSVAYAAGKALSELHKKTAASISQIRAHAITCGGKRSWGDLFRASSRNDTWPDYVEQQLSFHLTAHQQAGSLDKYRLDAVSRFVHERKGLWADPAHWNSAALIHSDYAPKNIHARKTQDDQWEICGIFDFEWALIGPIAMDFAKLQAYGFPRLKSSSQTEIYRQEFLQGYQELARLPSEHAELVATYELLFYLVWATIERNRENHAAFRAARQALDIALGL